MIGALSNPRTVLGERNFLIEVGAFATAALMFAAPQNRRSQSASEHAKPLLSRGNRTIVRPLARCSRGALTGWPMKRIDERELRDELVKLRAEHRELDDRIVLLEDSASADQLLVKRLKKKKLAVKDRMMALEDQLLPDIIA